MMKVSGVEEAVFGLSLVFGRALILGLAQELLGLALLPRRQLGLNTAWTKIEGNKQSQCL